MNRTAIYARTASPSETALDWQVQALQGLASYLSLNVTHIIRETASGLNFERPGLCELMDLVNAHDVDTILMKDLSRIGRDTPKVLAVVEEFDKHGVKLIIQGGDTVEIDDNPLLKYLRRFTSHPSLEVVLASTTELCPRCEKKEMSDRPAYIQARQADRQANLTVLRQIRDDPDSTPADRIEAIRLLIELEAKEYGKHI